MDIILWAFTILCFGYLIYPFINTSISLLLFNRLKLIEEYNNQFSYHCIITAFQDLSTAVPLIESLINLKYNKYLITVIADQCSKVELSYTSKNLQIIYPSTPLNSKVKSILAASKADFMNCDYSIIFDPDNIVNPDFLNELNMYHPRYEVVQCRRTAKNLDNYIACLDAAGEYYKNFVERKAPFFLGSSATIAGSGVSIKTELLSSFLNTDSIRKRIDGVILGEDKMLQNYIVNQNIIIAFKDDTLVFDEKIISNAQVKRQRTRWINAYFQNIKPASALFLTGLKNLSINQLLFGFNSLYPPLFLVVLFSGLVLLTDLIVIGFSTPFYLLTAGIVVFAVNFFLTLGFYKAPLKVFKALLLVPIFIVGQVLALLNLKMSKGDFLVTQKKKVTL